ncbi:MAG: tetratricopeptide repeat protein [Desulfobacterota bacterium]|nr:tetratricopeptide repeat protein [Thermodesulfobacteriota bacterium]
MKKLTTYIAGIMIFACSLYAAAVWADEAGDIQWKMIPEKTKMALYEAQQAMVKNDFQRAINILITFQKKRPEQNHALVDFNIGTAYGLLGNSDKAIEHLEKAVVLDPLYSAAWLNLGKLYYQKQSFGKAGAALEKAHALSVRKDPEVLFMAVASYYQASDFPKTIALGKDLLFTYGWEKNNLVEILASAAISSGNLQEATTLIRTLTERDPSNQTYWKLAAQAYFKNQQYKDATIAYEIFGYLGDLSREELFVMGDLFTMIGLPQRAAQYYEAALKDGGTAQEYDKLSIAYYCAYQFDKAVAAVDQAIAREENAERLLLKAQLLYVQDNFGEAHRYYVQAAQRMSTDGHEWLMAGYCAMRNGNVQLAKDLLRKASEYPAQRNDALAMLKSMSSGEEIQKAMQEFKQAYNL